MALYRYEHGVKSSVENGDGNWPGGSLLQTWSKQNQRTRYFAQNKINVLKKETNDRKNQRNAS